MDPSRVGTLIVGNLTLRDRDEAEVRGYRDAKRSITCFASQNKIFPAA